MRLNSERQRQTEAERDRLIILLIGIFLWNRRNMFVDIESVIHAFVRSSLLQQQILMFCSIDRWDRWKCFKDRWDNLYYSVYVSILVFSFRYKYCRKPSIVSIRVSPPPPQKHHPLFFAKSCLNLEIVQAPYILVFREPP